jgi:hypothetical protein
MPVSGNTHITTQFTNHNTGHKLTTPHKNLKYLVMMQYRLEQRCSAAQKRRQALVSPGGGDTV